MAALGTRCQNLYRLRVAKQDHSRWPIEPHTLAKHAILRRYLGRWFPIMAKRNARIIYVDGFAGPGRYVEGEDGSPIIALRIARDFLASGVLRPQQLTAIFVEQKTGRHRLLSEEVRALNVADPAYSGITCFVEKSDYASTMARIWSILDAGKAHIAPTFALIDPTGIKGVRYHDTAKLLSYPKTEVLVNLMYEETNRFRGGPEFEPHLDRFFGHQDWRVLRDIENSGERRRRTVEIFRDRLLEAGAKYVLSFEMKNASNATDYFLFFATKSATGLAAMKWAMWQVDKSGQFSFSDYTYAKGPMLVQPSPDYDALRRQLAQHFGGRRSVPMEEIELYVLAETSFYYYKREALKPMEDQGLLSIDTSQYPLRKKGTFPDRISVDFATEVRA